MCIKLTNDKRQHTTMQMWLWVSVFSFKHQIVQKLTNANRNHKIQHHCLEFDSTWAKNQRDSTTLCRIECFKFLMKRQGDQDHCVKLNALRFEIIKSILGCCKVDTKCIVYKMWWFFCARSFLEYRWFRRTITWKCWVITVMNVIVFALWPKSRYLLRHDINIIFNNFEILFTRWCLSCNFYEIEDNLSISSCCRQLWISFNCLHPNFLHKATSGFSCPTS